jgi:hypothetical protein
MRSRRAFTVQRPKYRPAVQVLNQVLGLAERLGAYHLNAEEILNAARRTTGLDDWGDEAFLVRLNKLIESANNKELSHLGRFAARSTFMQAVQNRLRVEDYIRRNPDVEQVAIKRPIFILGFPRTGTTLLQNLLSLSPGNRPLRFWEVTNPVPLHDDPTRDVARRQRNARNIIRLAYFIAPEQRNIHAIKVDSVEECWPLFFNDFAVLNYDLAMSFRNFGDWLLTTDMTGPYRYYRRQLQLLAHDQPANQLLLKCPEHLWFLDEIVDVFPDACIIWTHRDPLASTASYSSMTSLGHRTIYGEIKHKVIGDHTADRFHNGVTRAMAARDRLGNDRFFDVAFSDLVRDPITMVRRIRSHFDLAQPAGAEEAMASFLANKRSDARGAHVYSPEQWGLDRDAVHNQFADYIDRFEISLEGSK